MSPQEIEVGKTYHNGKEGPRSYSTRKVLDIGVRWFEPFNARMRHDGVEYRQVAGPGKGGVYILPMETIARWAKGEVIE
ncbi:hypothetical protein [Paenibacillus sp. 1P03SA]|uniref:hypothetical protein n=1 Tax=Paenibacillus sp. 1P03SA TaxID=3132294 RepID=UPI0039A3B73F